MRAKGRKQPEASRRVRSLPQIALLFGSADTRACPEGRRVYAELLKGLCLTPEPRCAVVSATIPKFVTDAKQAKRFFVSGFVQGVGFRNFTQVEARRLNLSGYVRNLSDGRVEAYAIGTRAQLAKFRAALERGPRFSSVSRVAEELADVDPQYASEFVTTYED